MPVTFIMTDGLRPDAVSPEITPHLAALQEKASYTLNGRSVVPSITLPCHTSIFHSAPPSRHGIIDNNWHSMARPITGLVEQLKNHEKRTTFIYNWEPLRDLNRVENLYASYFLATGYELDGDEFITETAIQYMKNPTDFTFVYYASVDVAGHKFGWMSDDYLKQASVIDALIKQVLDAAPDDMTFFIHSDHGGHERTHGTELDDDMIIPYFVTGPGIKCNYQIQAEVSLLDTAPTVARLLGVDPVQDWEGRVLEEIFESA